MKYQSGEMAERDFRPKAIRRNQTLIGPRPVLLPFVRCAAVGRRLGALAHAVVAQDAGDAQAVIGKHPVAAARLRQTVPLELAPALHRLLVAPVGKRQHLAFMGEAGKALDRNETILLLQLRPQRCGRSWSSRMVSFRSSALPASPMKARCCRFPTGATRRR